MVKIHKKEAMVSLVSALIIALFGWFIYDKIMFTQYYAAILMFIFVTVYSYVGMTNSK